MKIYDEIKRRLIETGMSEETLGKLVSAYDLIADAKGLSTSGNKAYILCMLTLDLYQIYGREAAKIYPVVWPKLSGNNHGTFYYLNSDSPERDNTGLLWKCVSGYSAIGGVWFAREVDRIEAVQACGIDEQFQRMCARFGIGGA